MALSYRSPWLLCQLVIIFYIALASAVTSEKPLQPIKKPAYAPAQAIPVSCLNRTIDTGEHIQDAQGVLQYIPFPVCNETGKPLELYFGLEQDVNCTIPFIDDTFFHLLEFYVHNDVPMTCRIPQRPLVDSLDSEREITPSTSTNDDYIPMIIALTGTLQKSHLHISNNLNVLLHAAPKSVAPGVIDAATAYSVSHNTRNTRIVIGDSLPLRLSVRWYPNTQLPSGWTGVGGHLYFSTIVYCLLSAGASAAICVAYFRGVELPRRLKFHRSDRLGFADAPGRGYGGGYGLPMYGTGNGVAVGKRD